LQNVPETEIYYLTLILPSALRTTYSFMITTDIKIKDESIPTDPTFPVPVGEFKKNQILLSQLFANNKVEIDQNNEHKIAYYIDFELQDKIFGVESILELPLAPKQPYISNVEQIKEEWNKFKSAKRFSANLLNFSDTCLKAQKDYANQNRKYWIWLPNDYDANQQYLFILFLDGSDFIDSIPMPMPSILDRMIQTKKNCNYRKC
jgi:hypothetical protein